MSPIRQACSRPYCRNFAEHRGRCLEHARAEQKAYDDARRESRPFYWSKHWRRLRALVLAEEPLCRRCLAEGKFVPTEEIDHILAIKDGGAELKRENCQGLCGPCHRVKTRREEAERRKRS
jgi:5-methylcytosine-specific restriction protein A